MDLGLIKSALTGKWAGDGEYYVSDRWEWFYRLKAAICLLLNREPKVDWRTVVNEGVHVTYTDGGVSYAPGEPTVHWAESLCVGHGVLSGWWVTLYQDSD